MKTILLIILFVFSILFPASNIFAPPSPNEWPAAPYCVGGCSMDYLKQRWIEYYDYKDEIPNLEGKFVDQVAQEKFLSDLENNLKNNQLPLGGHAYINFTLLLTIIGGAVVGGIFVIKRARK